MGTRLFVGGAPDVLYLVDLSGYVFRAYHAVAPLTSPSGEPTHAVYGTVNMLERLVRQCQPAYLAVALDAGRDTFRKEIYPEYKAHRPPAPDDLRVQMARVADIVDAFGVPVFRQSGVEADDLIATAVRHARACDLKVVIVSADKDLMPLVSDTVILWDTMRDRVFGPPEVEERFGVRVDQVRDLLALVGDTSDNVPGVPSVGPKTAKELLDAFGTLDGVFAHLDDLSKKKKLKETLATHEAQARLSQRLVTLDDTCPIEFDLERLRFGGRDIARLEALYTELGFERLLPALRQSAEGAPKATQQSATGSSAPPLPARRGTTVDVRTLVARAELDALADEARQRRRIAVAAVTADPLRGDAPVVALVVATTPGEARYVPLTHRYLGVPAQASTGDVRAALGPVLADASIAKVCHSSKSLRVALATLGVGLEGVDVDCELASYLLDAEARHDLVAIVETHTGRSLAPLDPLRQVARGRRVGLEEIEIERLAPLAGAQCEALLDTGDALQKGLDAAGLVRLLRDMELPLARMLAGLEQRGVLVDVSRLARLGTLVDRDLQRLEAEAQALVGRPFNVHSPRQLETLLFDDLGLKPLKRTKTSRSTDAETLTYLAEEHELPRLVLEIRQLAKLKGTYIDTLPSLVNPRTGRIHTRWEQAVAATGRLSSTDPNLQNIPIRTELGREIRAAFIAPPGHRIVSADYSQIELRVLAHLSGDPLLIDAFKSGVDVHLRTAMEIFEVAEREVTPELRRRAKAVNFGVIYGQGDSGLAKSLGIPRVEASSFIATYFRRYEGVRRFMDATLAAARESEYVHTLLGRRRLLPDIRSGNRMRRLAAERVAMNTPIQGTAADLLKLAMLRLAEPPTPGTRMTLTVHDELVFEVPEAEVSTAMAAVKVAMEGVYQLVVPLTVDVHSGTTWSEAH